jgi:AAA15 family ATPase/GTPase
MSGSFSKISINGATMLLEFSVENSKSFNKINTLSMISSQKKELLAHTIELQTSKNTKIRVNKLAAFFGANASGKSNFLSALGFMQYVVINYGLSLLKTKPNPNAILNIPYKPFRFHNETPKQPSTYQVLFWMYDRIYRYGFCNNNHEFLKEWLYVRDNASAEEFPIFIKNGNNVDCKCEDIKEYSRHAQSTNLFLTILAELSVPIYDSIMSFFQSINHTKAESSNIPNFLENIDENDIHIISNILRVADFGLNSFTKEKITIDKENIKNSIPKEIRKLIREFEKKSNNSSEYAYKVLFKHNIYSKDTISSNIDMQINEESDGTIAFIVTIAKIIDALRNNKILIIDEIDTSLHPILVESIIYLFTEMKHSRAQLIFSSHCPFLFDQNILRRDELWLVDKNDYGESTLISAAEFSARGDGNLVKQYMEGRFGGIPIVQNAYVKECCGNLSKALVQKQGTADHGYKQ